MEIPNPVPPPNLPLGGGGDEQQLNHPYLRKNIVALFGLIAGIAIIILGSFTIIGRAPNNFVSGTIIVIPQNASATSAAHLLVSKNIIRSSAAFETLVEIFNRPVIAGQFQFDKPENVFNVVETITGGLFGRTQVKVTIPEGSSNLDISKIILKQIPNFNVALFLKDANQYQGFLFPETYMIFKTETPDQFIQTMRDEFSKKITPLQSEILSSGHSEQDIIIMASILEKEAKNATDAQTISGILWKRISIGMALQVDAVPITYSQKGLPIISIDNPGLAMTSAAIHPNVSPYLYYLYDKTGTIHYAKTYAQQQANVAKYLR